MRICRINQKYLFLVNSLACPLLARLLVHDRLDDAEGSLTELGADVVVLTQVRLVLDARVRDERATRTALTTALVLSARHL